MMVGLELAPVGSESDGLPLGHGELKELDLYFNIKRCELAAAFTSVCCVCINGQELFLHQFKNGTGFQRYIYRKSIAYTQYMLMYIQSLPLLTSVRVLYLGRAYYVSWKRMLLAYYIAEDRLYTPSIC